MPPMVRRGPRSSPGHAPFRRADAALLVVLALVGTWIGHNVVYFASNGGGIVRQLTSPVHVYMLPVGALLLAVATAGGMVWARALARLRARLAGLQESLRHRDRASPAALGADRRDGSRAVDVVSVWLILTAMQLVLYIGQENLEARAVHAPLRGIAVVMGVHWVALPVHALLALGLSALAAGGRRTTARLERAVLSCARLVDRLRRLCTRVGLAALPTGPGHSLTPHQRWGRSCWERPPPFAAT